MAKIKLHPFQCPFCSEPTLVFVEILEKSFENARRYPMKTKAKCSNSHQLVVFVDKNKQIRDVESAAAVARNEKDARAKTKKWRETSK
ncbi:MAG: hypothetical protein ACFFEF_07140 [Candidatus Thorarchaeota archaeon]